MMRITPVRGTRAYFFNHTFENDAYTPSPDSVWSCTFLLARVKKRT